MDGLLTHSYQIEASGQGGDPPGGTRAGIQVRGQVAHKLPKHTPLHQLKDQEVGRQVRSEVAGGCVQLEIYSFSRLSRTTFAY